MKKEKIMKSEKSLLLLDIGNVLFHFHLDNVLEKLLDLKLFNCKSHALLFLKNSEAIINLGYTSIYDLIAAQDGGRRESLYRDFVSFWNSDKTLSPNLEIIKFINNNIKLTSPLSVYYGIISNMGKEHYNYIMSYNNVEVNTFFNNVSFSNFSYQTGYLKPQYNAFLRVFDQNCNKIKINKFISKHNVGKVLYIDDKLENLIVCKKVLNLKPNEIYQFDSDKDKKENVFEKLGDFWHY